MAFLVGMLRSRLARGGLADCSATSAGFAASVLRAVSRLRGLADRVAALDGTLRISSPPGAGTVVTAELPCGS